MTAFEKTIKTKVVDLENLWNFVVDNFFSFEIILLSKTTFEFLKFEIQIFFKWPRMEKLPI
jgi:hypothetical protein